MSDSFTSIIPIVPEFVPLREDASDAAAFLRKNYKSDNPIEPIFSTGMEFRDNGENLEKILCPRCGVSVESDWALWMDSAFANSKFTDRRIRTNCCGLDTELNELNYSWPVGFSRFAIVLMNPGERVSEQHLREVGTILKCQAKQILGYI